MGRVLSLLKLEPGEGSKVVKFAVLAALLQSGLAMGTGAADSLFLLHAGPARLPVIYVITPVVMLIYIPCYTYLTRVLGVRRLLKLTIGLLVAGGLAVSALLRASDAIWVFYIAKLYTGLWFVAQYSVFWNFTDDYFDIRDSKRIFPLLSSSSAIGAMTGGFLLNLLSARVPTAALFGLWAVLALSALPLAILIQRRHREIVAGMEPDAKPRLLDVVDTIGSAWRISRHVRLFVAIGFLSFVTAAICEYQYMTLFSAGRTEAQLTALFGELYMVVNAFNLVFGLFFFNRVVLRIGVPGMALIQPGAFLLAFGYLLVDPGQASALVGFFAYQGLMPAITYDAHNLLLNAAPTSIKAHIRTFVDGLAEPGAAATAGVFLLFFAAALGTARISMIGACAAGVYITLVLLMRSGYTVAMVQNLRRGWLDLANPPEHLLSGLPAADLTFLQDAASRPGDEGRAAVQILWLNDKRAAVRSLLTLLERSGDDERPALRTLVAQALDDGDPDVMSPVLEWLRARTVPELGPALVEELGSRGMLRPEQLRPFIGSLVVNERAAAAVALLNSTKLEESIRGGEIVRALLAEDGGTAAGVRAIGFSGRSQYAYEVAPFARHGSAGVRNEAVSALRRLVTADHHLLSADILVNVRDGSTGERIDAMETLARIADPHVIPPLLRIADAFTPLERRRAEAVIVRFGLQSIPVLVSILPDRTYPFKGRTVAARALGKLALPQLELLSEALIRDEIAHAYRGVWRWSLLERETPTPGLETLKRFYLDVRRDVVDLVLEVLAVGGRLPNFELLSASLGSDNRRERADAIETIEQGLTRDVFRLLLPLLDQRPPAAQAAFYQSRFAAEPGSLMQVLTSALDGTWLERLIAAQALCDVGPEGARILRERLETFDPQIAREIFSAIVPTGAAGAALTHVEKIHRLQQSTFFGRLGVQEAHVVARSAEPKYLESGEIVYGRGDFSDALFCVLDGSVELTAGARVVVKGPRDVFGDAGLHGEFLRAEDAVSRGARVLVVPNGPLLVDARNHPRIATVVFRNALETLSA